MLRLARLPTSLLQTCLCEQHGNQGHADNVLLPLLSCALSQHGWNHLLRFKMEHELDFSSHLLDNN